MSIEGVAHTPTQQDSHEQLQQRQGWSVAAMRQEIDSQANKIESYQRSMIDAICVIADLQANDEALTRQLNGHQAHVRNALTLLRAVNCGNLDQAKIRQAILELEDIDKRRGANAP